MGRARLCGTDSCLPRLPDVVPQTPVHRSRRSNRVRRLDSGLWSEFDLAGGAATNPADGRPVPARAGRRTRRLEVRRSAAELESGTADLDVRCSGPSRGTGGSPACPRRRRRPRGHRHDRRRGAGHGRAAVPGPPGHPVQRRRAGGTVRTGTTGSSPGTPSTGAATSVIGTAGRRHSGGPPTSPAGRLPGRARRGTAAGTPAAREARSASGGSWPADFAHVRRRVRLLLPGRCDELDDRSGKPVHADGMPVSAATWPDPLLPWTRARQPPAYQPRRGPLLGRPPRRGSAVSRVPGAADRPTGAESSPRQRSPIVNEQHRTPTPTYAIPSSPRGCRSTATPPSPPSSWPTAPGRTRSPRRPRAGAPSTCATATRR